MRPSVLLAPLRIKKNGGSMIGLYMVMYLHAQTIMVAGPIPMTVPQCLALMRVVVGSFVDKHREDDHLVFDDGERVPIERLTFECLYLNSDDVK